MTKLHTARGEVVNVLDRKDLILGVKALIGIFIAAVVVAFGFGQWITGTIGGMRQVHETLEVRTAHLPELTRNVDSLRIEMQHLTRALATLTDRMDRPIGRPARRPTVVAKENVNPLIGKPVDP